MRIAIRIIAAWEGLAALALVVLLALFVAMDTSGTPENLLAWALVVGLVVAPPLAAFAAVQLWRFRESGRRASMAFMGLFVVAAAVQGGGGVIPLGLGILAVVFLRSSGVKLACSHAISAKLPA